ncbi:MAG: hypothetical protein M0P31_06285 [Solirubrobacteraceae bacterium]|nr:hypothetical protein [Solirubrobacteraceae bacterium]
MGVLVQIRDVPEDVHRTLKLRAVAAGTSLSEYLRTELARAAERPSPDELRAAISALEPARITTSPAAMLRDLRIDGDT